MAKKQQNLLEIIHAAATHEAARSIVGRMSQKDLRILSEHIKAGSLMKNLTPIADGLNKEDVMRSMPPDLGLVIGKMSKADFSAISTHLQALPRDQKAAVSCGC